MTICIECKHIIKSKLVMDGGEGLIGFDKCEMALLPLTTNFVTGVVSNIDYGYCKHINYGNCLMFEHI